jgi:hypothetical protein
MASRGGNHHAAPQHARGACRRRAGTRGTRGSFRAGFLHPLPRRRGLGLHGCGAFRWRGSQQRLHRDRGGGGAGATPAGAGVAGRGHGRRWVGQGALVVMGTLGRWRHRHALPGPAHGLVALGRRHRRTTDVFTAGHGAVHRGAAAFLLADFRGQRRVRFPGTAARATPCKHRDLALLVVGAHGTIHAHLEVHRQPQGPTRERHVTKLPCCVFTRPIRAGSCATTLTPL